MILSTKQKNNVGDCLGYTWLDNMSLVCSSFILNTDDMAKMPIKSVKASEVKLDKLLMEAGKIYKLEQYNFIVVLDANYKHSSDKNYRVTEVENIDQVLQGHSYVTIPTVNYNPRRGSEKIYSPNQAYYYLYGGDAEGAVITIYDATNDKQLTQTPLMSGSIR